MAIEWTTSITNANTNSRRANVAFTRTDTENAAATFTVSYKQAVIETTEQRTALLDQVWAAWQAEEEKRSNIAAFLSNLEQLANSNLMAREV